MLPVIFQLNIFGSKNDVIDWKYSHSCLKWLLEALVNCNRAFLKEVKNVPELYQTQVRYARERGTEDWCSIPVCHMRGYGDCEDLSAWRVAELREKTREPAKPYLKFRRSPNGAMQYHIQVLRMKKDQSGKWIDSHVEDPSRNLGMNTDEWKPLSPVREIRTEV